MQKAILVVGPPGSGKGTQAKLIAKKFGYKHVSTGDILRKLNKNSTLGKKVFALINKGNFIPPKLAVQITLNYIKSNKKILVLDGFPRTLNQAIALDDLLANKNIQIDHIIQVDVDEKLLFERIKQRAEESDFVRNDDNKDVLIKRITVYQKDTMPVLEYYRSLKRLKTVDGMQSIENVSSDIKKMI